MLLRLLPLVVFAAIAGFLWRGLSLDPAELPSALIDRPAPSFTVATLPGRAAEAARLGSDDVGEPSSASTRGSAADGADTGVVAGAADVAVSAERAPRTAGSSSRQADEGADDGGARTFDSTSMAGRVWVLNVWASWCGPCAQEHPQLVALAGARDVPIVGLNYKDDPNDARAWLRRHGDVFDEVLADGDGRVGIDWGVYGVPETFVIDAAGRVRHKHVGPILPDDLEKTLMPIIDALVAAS